MTEQASPKATNTYASRGAAVRAARLAAKKFFGPAYEAHEGPDYIIHSFRPWGELRDHYRFQARWA